METLTSGLLDRTEESLLRYIPTLNIGTGPKLCAAESSNTNVIHRDPGQPKVIVGAADKAEPSLLLVIC